MYLTPPPPLRLGLGASSRRWSTRTGGRGWRRSPWQTVRARAMWTGGPFSSGSGRRASPRTPNRSSSGSPLKGSSTPPPSNTKRSSLKKFVWACVLKLLSLSGGPPLYSSLLALLAKCSLKYPPPPCPSPSPGGHRSPRPGGPPLAGLRPQRDGRRRGVLQGRKPNDLRAPNARPTPQNHRGNDAPLEGAHSAAQPRLTSGVFRAEASKGQ